MNEEVPVFRSLENDDTKIWRYLDFTKFVSLIDTSELFFARADKFEDAFEGSWPRRNIEKRASMASDLSPDKKKDYDEFVELFSRNNEKWRRYVAINCWHENEHESAAMWKLYLKSDEGVAIQSTCTRLNNVLIGRENILIDRVSYIDYEKDILNESNAHIDPFRIQEPLFYKRKSFEHEREIRALVIKLPVIHGAVDLSKETIEHGVSIKVDLNILIERIYIAPTAPIWFSNLVISTINRFGYGFEVVHSRLNGSPLF